MPIRGLSNTTKKFERLKNTLQTKLPKLVQNDAIRHFRDNFKAQGFVNGGLRRWAPVKVKRKSGKVLLRTSALINSIRAGRADWSGIQVVAGGSGVPYARAHNEGITLQRQVTRRAHTRRAHFRVTKRGQVSVPEHSVARHQARLNLHIRKRQFMGKSRELEVRMRGTVINTVRKAMQ